MRRTEPSPQPLWEQFEAYVAQVMAVERVPAVSVAFARDGEIVYVWGFGWQDRERGISADAATVYGVASVTKSFTAACILQLEEAGKLSVTDPVRRHLPGFRVSDPAATGASPFTICFPIPVACRRCRCGAGGSSWPIPNGLPGPYRRPSPTCWPTWPRNLTNSWPLPGKPSATPMKGTRCWGPSSSGSAASPSRLCRAPHPRSAGDGPFERGRRGGRGISLGGPALRAAGGQSG